MAITKNIIPVSIEDRFIAVSDHTQITAGNVGVDFVAITLDAEWEGLNVYVTFAGCAQDPTTLDYAAELEVPWEQIEEAGDLYIGVQGFDPSADVSIDLDGQLVTNGAVPTVNAMAMTVPIKVRESGASSGVTPTDPTPGTLQRVEQDLLALERSVSSADKAVADAEAATASANAAAASANTAADTANAAAAAANTAKADTEAATSAANAAAQAANDAAASVDASKTAALNAADKANTAAAQADTARDAAQAVADAVDDYMARAEAAATAAEASQAASATSEANAAASAQTATEKASEANTAASNAQTSHTAAAASASAASASETAAASSANAASASASAAKTSETNAKSSETAAASSQTAASTSEANAKASETAAASSASAAKSSETAAAASASTASSKADAAASSESAAAASANSASASQAAAALSEANAAASEDAAKAAADKAESIAGFTVDTEVSADSTNPVASKAVYSYVAQMFADFTAVTFSIVDSYEALPAVGEVGTFYFVPAASTGTSDMYSEYVWLDGAYEKFGDIQLPDLSPYAKMTWVTEQIGAQLASYYTKTDVDGLLAGKQDTLTIDAVPTEGSSNPVSSGGTKAEMATKADASTVTALSGTVNELAGAVANKQDRLTFDATPTSGSSNPVTSDGIRSYVDSKSANVEYLSNADFLALLGA